MSALRSTKCCMSFLSLVLVFVVILSTEARAEIYPFGAITNNSATPGVLAQQLCVEVVDSFPGEVGDQALFTFYNNGLPPYQVSTPIESTIALILFDDGTLLGPPIIFNSPGGTVLFSAVSGSPTLPGGNSSPYFFQTSVGFGADAAPPPSHNGVDEWNSPEDVESVGIAFDFAAISPGVYYDFDDLLAAIDLGFSDPFNDNALRIGIHVINIGEKSDTFIMTPVPGAVLLGMLGLGVAGLKLHRFT